MRVVQVAGPETTQWPQLAEQAERLLQVPTRELFARDPGRYERFSREAAGLLLDFSRQHLDEVTLLELTQLAEAVGLRTRIEAMFRGERINTSEDRPALHIALRQRAGEGIGGTEVEQQVLRERERMLAFATAVRSGIVRGSATRPFSLVVNIGIGGSDLGPAMAAQALRRFSIGAPRCEFVSNVDGNHLADVLSEADPAQTLFIVSSKTFTTLETLANARTARGWLVSRLGEAAVPQHFAAVSVNQAAMDEFRVHPDYRFKIWDWVGGRYSIWSSIGLALAIAIGADHFREFLEGGREVDVHFRAADWGDNLPALLGLLNVWNINFLHLPTLAVLPYDECLRRFPAYLQQLEMESNGKSVRLDGRATGCETAPVVWGEPGNNAQHSFFQLLHQGTSRAALDLLLPALSSSGNQPQQNLAIASCLAQAQALMEGQSAAVVLEELANQPLPPARRDALIPHKVNPGSRPVTLIVFRSLDPATLGRLIALYEHSVLTQSVVWGINAFDQWGVELGKKLTAQLEPAVDAAEPPDTVPPSLLSLLRTIARWRSASELRSDK